MKMLALQISGCWLSKYFSEWKTSSFQLFVFLWPKQMLLISLTQSANWIISAGSRSRPAFCKLQCLKRLLVSWSTFSLRLVQVNLRFFLSSMCRNFNTPLIAYCDKSSKHVTLSTDLWSWFFSTLNLFVEWYFLAKDLGMTFLPVFLLNKLATQSHVLETNDAFYILKEQPNSWRLTTMKVFVKKCWW